MIHRHKGWQKRANTFQEAWETLATEDPPSLTTSSGTPFTAEAHITTKGTREGEKAIRYLRDGEESARSHDCCWSHCYNCNRTRIGMYSSAVDDWVTSHRYPNRLDREQLLRLIEKNSGPRRLDLSCCDLSGLNLGSWAIELELRKRGFLHTQELPRWASLHTSSLPIPTTLPRINLQGAQLDGADLSAADLSFADLSAASLMEAALPGAQLRGCNLAGATLYGADLRDADLSWSRLRHCDFSRANLRRAILFGADARDAVFLGADLTDANLRATQMHRAHLADSKLTGTTLTLADLGEQVGEHRHRDYGGAMRAYSALKNNFADARRYPEASWAYIKEREMEKMTHAPWAARTNYSVSDSLPTLAGPRSPKWWLFYFVHTCRWLTAWLVQLTCGYGESISRTLATLALVYAVFTLGYGLTWGVMKATVTPQATTLAFTANPVDWGIFSLGALTTMDPANLEPRTNWVQLAAGIEALLGIFLTGLLGFVVASRIRRS